MRRIFCHGRALRRRRHVFLFMHPVRRPGTASAVHRARSDDPANQVVAVTNAEIIAIVPHAKAQLSASPGGIAVNRGAMLGNIGNIQQGAADGTITVPTTRHLHVEISIPIVNPSTGNLESARLPPYASLVEAYQRLQAGTP